MHSNKILNFQESMTNLNADTKKYWKLIVCLSYIYIYIYICILKIIFIKKLDFFSDPFLAGTNIRILKYLFRAESNDGHHD